jgi:hypothetical protein
MLLWSPCSMSPFSLLLFKDDSFWQLPCHGRLLCSFSTSSSLGQPFLWPPLVRVCPLAVSVLYPPSSLFCLSLSRSLTLSLSLLLLAFYLFVSLPLVNPVDIGIQIILSARRALFHISNPSPNALVSHFPLFRLPLYPSCCV